MSEAHGGESGEEIYDALRALREEPYGKARSARTEELVDTAERLGQDEALVAALLELLTAYEYGDEVRKAPVLFNRILGLYKDKPDAFDDWGAHRLFWCFKWITSALLSVPEIPLATIERWIGLMREHYTAAGKPMQAVHTSRYRLAAHTGTGVTTAYELWITRPRDEFSDCEACEARMRGAYWLTRGDDARALREWQPVLDGVLGCAEEPAATISRALLPLVRVGRAEEAVSFHRSGYRATKGKAAMDGEVSRHLEFLALTGNTARGLELLAENRGRFDSDTDAHNRLTFLGGVMVLLNQVVALDAQTPVPGPGGRTYPAAELLADIAAQTDDLAGQFDERNGTTWQGDLLRARRARQPLTDEPLPLGVRVATDVAATPAVVHTVPVEPLPEQFETLLAEAREALANERPETERLWLAVADRVTQAEADGLLRAELADREAFRLIAKRSWVEAAEKLHEAAAQFEKAAEPGRAVSRRARAAWCAFMQAESEQAVSWDELDAVLADADDLRKAARISPEDYVIVLHSRAAAAMRASAEAADEDATAQARERTDREIEAFRSTAVQTAVLSRAAVATAMAGTVLARDGQFKEALVRVDAAIALGEQAQRPWILPRFLGQRGQLLNRLGRLDEAAAELHRSLALHNEWPDADFDEAGIFMELARNRLHADDARTAIAHLTTAAAKFDRRGDDVAAANARAMLGDALLRADRQSDAIAVFESLLDEPAEAELIPQQRAQIRLELGRALIEQDEPRSAAEVFARLADFIAPWPNEPIHTLVACELGAALYAARLWEQADAAMDRALATHAESANPAAICVMLRVGAEATYRHFGPAGTERALDLLRRADEINLATEEIEGQYRRWPETGQNANLRTRALASVNRDEEALAAADAAIAAWRLGGREAIGPLAEATRVAAILEGVRLERRTKAAARLRPVIASSRDAGHEQAVTILSKLLADLGG